MDLLVQYFDPEYARLLQSKKLNYTNEAANWIESMFVAFLSDETLLSFFDLIFQSTDGLVLLFTALVCLMNRRDNPELEISDIQPEDLTDLIQLALFYQEKTPFSFLQRMRDEIFKAKKAKIEINNFLVLPVSAEQVVKVLKKKREASLCDCSQFSFVQIHVLTWNSGCSERNSRRRA